MAVQISDNKLSPLAKKALNNAANKSQFLRDAIEYYVRRGEESQSIADSELKKDIKEIKELLQNMDNLAIANQLIKVNDAVAAKEEVAVTAAEKEEDESDDSVQEEIPSCYDF